VTKVAKVAQNTDSTGEKPIIHEHDDRHSDRKWNQYCLVRFHTESTLAIVASCMLYLRASSSTSGTAQVEQHRRDGRHQDHVEIRDLQELGDQEGGRTQHRPAR